MKIFKLLFLLGLIIGSSGASAAAEITRYHIDDKLTQSSLILDEVGNVISRERLKSFGGVEHSTRGTEEWQHSYHGKQRHTSHGLVDFGARFYDPEIGRFISMDPRGFRESSPDSFNRYAFANNNPYRYTDPDGRVVETAWDVANVGLGLASLSSNLSDGNWSAAALDTAGLAFDGLASVIPFLPGGASASIKAGRAVDSAASAAKSADVTKGLAGVPGRVQSRINVSNEGWAHVLKRHFSGKPNASQFSVSQSELKSLLQSKQVVGSPVTRTVESADGLRYVREIDMGRAIGVDAMNGNAATSVMTTMSDKYGNLITAFPGVLK